MAKIKPHCIRKPAVLSPPVPENAEPVKVRDNTRWEDYSTSRGIDVWQLIRFNYPTLPPNNKDAALEVNWYLENYVGCTEVTTDQHNYSFRSKDHPGVIYLPLPKLVWVPPWRKWSRLIIRPGIRFPNYWRYDLALGYMHQEMITNAESTDVADLAALNSGWSPTDKGAALVIFASLVQVGGLWDHKPILRRTLALKKGDMHFPFRGDSKHEFFYDIWSNVHYGFVGRAAGFSAAVLQAGHHLGGIAGASDPFDDKTVQMGIDLWDTHGTSLSRSQLEQALLDAVPHMLKIQETAAYADSNGSFRHVEDMSNYY
ncbi:hypothetical protein F183_A38550 [Bryobacterales bacterium F-183]|nr:hypothetical protein F183_A38550 [Bryobacterales bacterium F-183]